MKYLLTLILSFLILVGYSQCDNGTNYYPSSIYSPGVGLWSSASTCNWAGEVIQVEVKAGDVYQFSTCDNYGGSLASYDTQLTLRDFAGTLLDFNDDAFGCTGYTSYINWTATYSGIVYVHLNEYYCMSNTTCTRVMIYRTEAVTLPGPCTSNTSYTSRDFPTQASPYETIGCYYAGEYCTWSNPEDGVSYTISSTRPTDWITVTIGAFDGLVVTYGTNPLVLNSAIAGETYFIHVNVDDLCKVESACRDITMARQSSLPIDLISFNGEVFGGDIHPLVVIDWSVASQVNNDYYEVQRSIDVEQWYTIETVTGAGNSNTQMSYSIIDDNPLSGISYYRLKQTDYDGQTETFFPLSIIISSEEKEINKVINFMGQEVNEYYKGMVLEIYQDGTYVKKYYE